MDIDEIAYSRGFNDGISRVMELIRTTHLSIEEIEKELKKEVIWKEQK